MADEGGAIRMGSEDNPVVLDQYQTIVEVGWPSLIAFSLRLKAGLTRSEQAEFCRGVTYEDWIAGGPVGQIWTAGVATVYTTNLQYDYLSPPATPFDPIPRGSFYQRLRKGEWTEIEGEKTVTGLTTFPRDQEIGAWSYLVPAAAGAGAEVGRTRWIIEGDETINESEDSDVPIKSPHGGDFIKATNAKLEVMGLALSGGGACTSNLALPFGSSSVSYGLNAFDVVVDAGPSPAAPSVMMPRGAGLYTSYDIELAVQNGTGTVADNSTNINVSGVVLEIIEPPKQSKKTYKPIGLSVVNWSNHLEINGNPTLWILCKRAKAAEEPPT